jgi:hypothetical protein
LSAVAHRVFLMSSSITGLSNNDAWDTGMESPAIYNPGHLLFVINNRTEGKLAARV